MTLCLLPACDNENASDRERIQAIVWQQHKKKLQQRLKKLSAEVVGGSVDDTAKYLREEVDRWNAVIKATKNKAKIKAQ
jgi:tripartite-type tricarboxylate transporter receptor subunit TctC